MQAFNLLVHLLYLRVEGLTNSARVITQDCNLIVRIVVELELGRVVAQEARLFRVILQLVELLVQSERRVVSTEDFCCQARHQVLEVGIQTRGVELVKDIVRRLLAVARQRSHVLDNSPEILLLSLSHKRHARIFLPLLRFLLVLRPQLNKVLVLDRVFAQEVEVNRRALFVRTQCDMFHSETAATHGIGLFVRILLVTCTNGQVVDQP
mmetsp:Transcript_44969/g.141569  ORF Transcript_44969/g.141569 Transcript_44969/m.141569 type:complete len:209 (-) Transcript_44969:1199-1825(-)